MWQDMITYWAWRGPVPAEGLPPTPTTKRLEYAEVISQGRHLTGQYKGERIRMRLAVTVFDNEVPREINRDELKWHRGHGAEVKTGDAE